MAQPSFDRDSGELRLGRREAAEKKEEFHPGPGPKARSKKGSVVTPFCTEFTVQNMASHGLGAHCAAPIPRFVRKTLKKRAAGSRVRPPSSLALRPLSP